MSGESPLVIPDSAERVNKRLELGGKTEQVQTTGAQLLNKDNFFVNPPTTFDKLKYYPLNIGDKECTLSTTCPASGNTSNLFLLAGNIDKGASSSVNGVSFGISRTVKSQDGYVTIALRTIGDNPNNPLDYDIMLNYGSAAQPYEPYTGNKPSPSPEYPQEIKNSGKWNEETQRYEVDVKVTGKNLLNLQKEPDVKGTYQGWKVGNGEPLTFGVKDKGNNADIKGCYIGFSYQGSEPNGAVWVVDNGVIKAHPLTQRKAYVSIFPANETAVKKLTERFDIQCELGNVATTYQPYKEQTLTITSDRPLTKWDRLVEQGGQIGWLYQSEIDDNVKPSRTDLFPYGFSLYKNQENGTYTYKSTNIKKAIGFQTSYCKQFRNKDAAYQSAELWHYSDQPSMKIQYFNTDIATVEEFIEWMESNPLTMVFKTESATFAPLPQSEQNAIRALKTYYPTTVITADGGELDPDIKVTYTADTKNYIDNKFGKTINAMQTKLLELESRV